MMIPIKIECDCGQHYAFDVEPVNGHMPSPVTCPACGADGTPAANQIISRQLASQPAASPIRLIESPNPVQPPVPPIARPALTVAAEAVVPITIPAARTIVKASVLTAQSSAPAAPAPTVTRRDPRLGQVDRPQAEHEARAKMMWGDSQEEVTKYLMMQGFSCQEALPMVQALFLERAVTIRANGFRKIFTGSGLVCVPIIALFIFLHLGVIPMKLFGLTIMVGLYGAYLVLKGILMAVAPKSELGDVSEQ